MKQVGSLLWPKFRVLQVYGANTGVGKTVFSSILCRAFQKRLPSVAYLKPVSTGPADDADDRYAALLPLTTPQSPSSRPRPQDQPNPKPRRYT